MQATRRAMLIFLFIIMTSVLTTASPIAQTTLQLEQLQIDLWPEHDRLGMLIIYRGRLPSDAPLPATLTLRLPAGVGDPHAVAYDDGTGALMVADYSTVATEDWLLVTLETPEPNFQLEFYDDLVRVDDQRTYTFTWPGDYAVNQLNFSFLPPPNATEIQTEPVLSPAEQETGSLSYRGTSGSLAAGQEAQLRVSYRGGPSVINENISSPATNGNNNTPFIVGAIIAVALLLVILGGMWYTRRPAPQVIQAPPSQRRPKRSRSQRRRIQSERSLSKEDVDQDRHSTTSYCTHCGRPLQEDDRFCGRCGTPVKGQK